MSFTPKIHAWPVLAITFLLAWQTAHAESLNQFKVRISQIAGQQGMSTQAVGRLLTPLSLNQAVLDLDRKQPEFTTPIWEYINGAVTPQRLKTASKLITDNAATIRNIAHQYQVDAEILAAIWGLESSFGSNTGSFSVLRSLLTLAYAGREKRRPFWQKELLAALSISLNSKRPLRGSWAGAMGHTQFMPSTFMRFAVDQDGRGIDLKHSAQDALASAANYLGRSGWRHQVPWGFAVQLPAHFDWHSADPNVKRPLGQWFAMGVRPIENRFPMAGVEATGSILLPTGHQGPAFIVLPNFDVILEYNRSTHYALAIGRFIDRLKGGPALNLRWPSHEPQLSRSQKTEIQQHLNVLGFNTGGIDGKIGPKTRQALRAWQALNHFVPDGHPTLSQLKALRSASRAP